MSKIITPKPPQISIEEFQEIRETFAQRGPGDRVEQFRKIADALAPGLFEWHSWTLKLVEAACKYRWLACSGCSNSCKTFNSANFAAVWWLADPENSSVIFCSTTMKMLRKRGWAEIQNFHRIIGGDVGNLVNSQCVWQVSQGDDKHAIFGKAVCEGDVNKSAADIQGIHTKRQMVIIDEAEAVPAAIWKAAANLYGYCVDTGGEFILMALANARSRLSQFGRFIEPEDGWGSISVDSDDWNSKPQMDGRKARVLRFDFRKSPNIIEGRMVSRHLPTRQRVESRLAALRARGGENDPEHWAFDLGFPVPEGLIKTVFTESLLEKYHAYDRHQFTGSDFTIIGAFDPAYLGGDRPALRFAALGDIGGKMGLEWMDPIVLYIDATSAEPARYQLVSKLKDQCKSVNYRGQKYECLPENFGIDASGDGGLADICQREWSSKIIRIQFGGSASTEPCSHEDERPANEVYENKRAEMFFRTLNAITSEQLKGIDKDTAEELCTIEQLGEKTSDGTMRRRIVIQPKKEFKKKYGKSSDLSDCGIMCCEVARLKGFTTVAIGETLSRAGALEEIVKDSQELYDPQSFYSSENDEILVDDEY